MFKRTVDVSCSLKESIDGLEIIVCGKMFHCTIVCGKNDHLYGLISRAPTFIPL